jgi:hypothetical protein
MASIDACALSAADFSRRNISGLDLATAGGLGASETEGWAPRAGSVCVFWLGEKERERERNEKAEMGQQQEQQHVRGFMSSGRRSTTPG